MRAIVYTALDSNGRTYRITYDLLDKADPGINQATSNFLAHMIQNGKQLDFSSIRRYEVM